MSHSASPAINLRDITVGHGQAAPMDFRNLRYFVEIVERGSMKRAAESLYVAQPALSQQVKKLEEELGVKLLARSVRGVVPTEAGRELLTRARLILDQVHDARQVIQAGSRDPQGSVVLGLPSSVSAALSGCPGEGLRA